LKKFASIVLLMFAFAVTLAAQSIYFCTGHTSDGDPINPVNTFKIKPSGGYLYILFNNDGKKIETGLIYLFIDKKMNGNFEPFDSKVLRLDSATTWTAYNYKFSEPGKYLIYFLDSKQNKIAQDTLHVELESEFKRYRQDVTSDYYYNCEMVFCEIVLGGKPIRITNHAYLKKNNGLIYVYLNNGTPFNTPALIVDVWKKGNDTEDYDEFIETKYFKIDPEWSDTYFKYIFKEPGEYKFSVYNKHEALIISNYIQVYR